MSIVKKSYKSQCHQGLIEQILEVEIGDAKNRKTAAASVCGGKLKLATSSKQSLPTTVHAKLIKKTPVPHMLE